MALTLCITDYVEGAECAHCNRVLRHGIVTDNGIVGAQCFAKKLTAPRIYKGKAYRLDAGDIVSLAKKARSPCRFGLRPEHFTFEAA